MFEKINNFLSIVIFFLSIAIYCIQTEGYKPGVWSSYIEGYFEKSTTSTRKECTQRCWRDFVAGMVYVGAHRQKYMNACVCTTTSMGKTTENNSNWELKLHFIYAMATPQTMNSTIGNLLLFNIRIKFFSETNGSSSIFFIDNIDNPTTYSKRMLIKNFVSSVNPIRTSYARRVLQRNSDSQTVNSVLETFVGNEVEKEFENSYAIVTKVTLILRKHLRFFKIIFWILDHFKVHLVLNKRYGKTNDGQVYTIYEIK